MHIITKSLEQDQTNHACQWSAKIVNKSSHGITLGTTAQSENLASTSFTFLTLGGVELICFNPEKRTCHIYRTGVWVDPTAYPDVVQNRKSLPFARIWRHSLSGSLLSNLQPSHTDQAKNHGKFQFYNKTTGSDHEYITLHLYRVIKNSRFTWWLQYKYTQKYFKQFQRLEDGNHSIHSQCGPSYTEHGLRDHSSACQ
jgi:hypothetical protein